MNKQISVIGLGYVGLPLAVAAAKSSYKVFGIDLDSEKINTINKGIPSVEGICDSELLSLIKNGKLTARTDYSSIIDSEVVLICVPTPLTENSEPDLSFLELAVKCMAENLSRGTLVILESTVSTGTTQKIVIPMIEKYSKLDISEIHLVFSPERIDPINKTWDLKNTPKIVAGVNDASEKKAVEFYSKFIDTIVKVDSLEVAETAKLLENCFRFINISFVNEFSVFCEKMGIDVNKVVNAAATKPYGFMPFFPSIGIGGHCIPVDPLYLANKAREIGAPTRFIDLAVQINQEMPGYFVGRAEEKIGGLAGKKVLVIGVSYKPNIADVRETPVEALILGLKNKGVEVFWHDDLVKEWNGENSVAISNEYDLAILATPHAYLDLTKLGDVPILNTRGSI